MDRKLIAIGGALSLAVLIAGTGIAIMTGRQNDQFADCGGSAVAGSAIGGPFELLNAEGQTVTDADIITGPTILYFGYTFCPDV